MKKQETDFSLEFKTFITEHLLGVTGLKHCDRFTAGIPDLTFSTERKTLWVETKRVRIVRHVVDNPKGWVDNTAQLDLAVRLGAWYLVIDPIHDQYLFTTAREVYRAYHHAELISEVPGAVRDDGDRWAFYGNVLLTVSKELKTL